MKRTGRRKEGFTLIEVVVSIAILGLVSIPFCNSLMVGYRSATSADSLLNSHLEATSIVEELMADGISVTEATDDTGSSIAVNDIVIDTSDTDDTYSGYTASITSSDDGSYTITCYNSDQTEGYSASFVSPADYSSSDPNIYPCTYTDSDGEAHEGICFLISDYSPDSTDFDAAACTFIMNFNCEFMEVTYTEDDEGNTKMVVEEDDDVLTLVFASNFDYPGTSTTSIGASDSVTIISSDGSTATGTYNGNGTFTDAGGNQYTVADNGDGTVTMNGAVYTVTETESSDGTTTQTWTYAEDAPEEADPYWYDVAVSQGNVNINTSIRLADQDEDTEDTNISVTITDADGNTATGTYYASQGIFITSDSSTSYTAAKNDDGTVTLTDGSGASTTYTVAENDDGSQTWTAASS